MKYLHTPHVTVPFRATDHTTRDVLICESKNTGIRESLARAEGG